MIDLQNEMPITLAQAARMLPPNRRGRPVTLSCLLRWVVDGVRTTDGRVIRLGASRLGGRWLTTVQSLERFAAAQTPHLDDEPRPELRTPGRRHRASARAAKALEEAGI